MAEKQKLADELRQIADQFYREKGTAELAALRAEEERRKRETDKLVRADIERIESELKRVAIEGKTRFIVNSYRSKDVVELVVAWGIEQRFTVESQYVPGKSVGHRHMQSYFVLMFSW